MINPQRQNTIRISVALLLFLVCGCAVEESEEIKAEQLPETVKEEKLPETAKAAMIQGLAAAKLEKWDLAIKHFKEAREIAPYAPEVLFNLALAYDMAGRDFFAIPGYRAYLASASGDATSVNVRVKLVMLEDKVSTDIYNLIYKAKESLPGVDEYLYNASEAVYVAFGIKTPADERRREITELRTAYRNKHIAKVYAAIAAVQIKTKDFAGARATASRIADESGFSKSDIYKEINEAQRASAYYQLLDGDIAGAMETASGITDVDEISYINGYIVGAQADAGDIDGAKQTASLIKRKETLSYAYRKIGEALARAGDKAEARKMLTQAVETASLIKEDNDKNNVLIYIVRALGDVGDFAGAKKAIALIPPSMESRYHLSSQIAVAQAKTGDISGAIETVAWVEWEYVKNNCYREIAGVQAKAGDIAGARQTASGIPDNSVKSDAYSNIAIVQRESGDKKGARKTLVQAMKDASSANYVTIARLQLDMGDTSRARKSLVRAARIAASSLEDIPTGSWQSIAYLTIVEEQTRADDIRGAKKTASQILDESYQSSAYNEIARSQTKAGGRVSAAAIAKTKEQERMEDEIKSWAELAATEDFSKPTLVDLHGFLASLKGNSPDKAIESLAMIAGDMADASNQLRYNETDWQKRRRGE